MSIHPIMQKLAAKLERTDLPEFAPGDTLKIMVKVIDILGNDTTKVMMVKI